MNSTSHSGVNESKARNRIGMSDHNSACRKPTLDIVIINWNSGSQLKRCLCQIETAVKKGVQLDRIVVVDNASSDSSIADLTVQDDRLVILRNRRNTGFAAACNQGAKDSRANYLLFMNPDVYLGADSLSIPTEFLSRLENSNVAICGPRLVGQDAVAQKTCSRFPTTKDLCAQALGLGRLLPDVFRVPPMNEWAHDHNRTVDQVIGACLFVRRKVFEQLRGFDERFFVYFEEVDLCLRCKKSGHEIFYLNEASAVHTGGGCSNQVPGKRLFYLLRSRILYARKHFSTVSAAVVSLVTIFIEPLSRLYLATAHGSVEELRGTLEGYSLLWRSLSSLFTLGDGAETRTGSSAQAHSKSADYP
jgi:hypothetical protein